MVIKIDRANFDPIKARYWDALKGFFCHFDKNAMRRVMMFSVEYYFSEIASPISALHLLR